MLCIELRHVLVRNERVNTKILLQRLSKEIQHVFFRCADARESDGPVGEFCRKISQSITQVKDAALIEPSSSVEKTQRTMVGVLAFNEETIFRRVENEQNP